MQSDYSEMLGFLEQSEIEIWVSTPSFADMCLADRNFCGEKIKALKLFLFCGEVLTTATVEKLKERFPEAVIINTYGPTESTVSHGCDYNREVIAGDHCGANPSGRP